MQPHGHTQDYTRPFDSLVSVRGNQCGLDEELSTAALPQRRQTECKRGCGRRARDRYSRRAICCSWPSGWFHQIVACIFVHMSNHRPQPDSRTRGCQSAREQYGARISEEQNTSNNRLSVPRWPLCEESMAVRVDATVAAAHDPTAVGSSMQIRSQSEKQSPRQGTIRMVHINAKKTTTPESRTYPG